MPAYAVGPTLTRRKTWTQSEIAALVYDHARSQPYLGQRSPTEVEAKLRELGLVEKPEKPMLTERDCAVVNTAIADMLDDDELKRTLQVRYAIKQLQALLPKREPKTA